MQWGSGETSGNGMYMGIDDAQQVWIRVGTRSDQAAAQQRVPHGPRAPPPSPERDGTPAAPRRCPPVPPPVSRPRRPRSAPARATKARMRSMAPLPGHGVSHHARLRRCASWATSNCGLISAISSPPGASLGSTAGSTASSEMKLTSMTITCDGLGEIVVGEVAGVDPLAADHAGIARAASRAAARGPRRWRAPAPRPPAAGSR